MIATPKPLLIHDAAVVSLSVNTMSLLLFSDFLFLLFSEFDYTDGNFSYSFK